jgi:hypothetical protein
MRRGLNSFDTLYAAEAPSSASITLASSIVPLPSAVSAAAAARVLQSGHSNAHEFARARARDLSQAERSPLLSRQGASVAAAKHAHGVLRPSSEVSSHHGYAIDSRDTVYQAASTRKAVLSLWLSFKSLCALSQTMIGIDRTSFASFVQVLRCEDDAFVQRAFDLLDRSGSGAITWHDYSLALEKLESGGAQERADFLLELYDRQGSGIGFTRDDLYHFFLSSVFAKDDAEAPGLTAPAAKKGLDSRTLLERVGNDSKTALITLIRAFSDETFDAIADGALPSPTFITKEMLRLYVEKREKTKDSRAPLDVAAILGRCLLTGDDNSVEYAVINSSKSR